MSRFYGGGKREKEILWRAYLQLIKHINSIYKIRIAYEWTEDYVIKYLWSAAGYVLIAIPYLLTRRKRHVAVQTTGPIGGRVDDQVADRTESAWWFHPQARLSLFTCQQPTFHLGGYS